MLSPGGSQVELVRMRQRPATVLAPVVREDALELHSLLLMEGQPAMWCTQRQKQFRDMPVSRDQGAARHAGGDEGQRALTPRHRVEGGATR